MNFKTKKGDQYTFNLSMVPGMDLRDWFAGMALQGVVVDGYCDCPELAADHAYKIADAMMEQRKRPATPGKE